MDELNKREFLKTTALLGTATVVPSIASAGNQGVAAAAVVSPVTDLVDEHFESSSGRHFGSQAIHHGEQSGYQVTPISQDKASPSYQRPGNLNNPTVATLLRKVMEMEGTETEAAGIEPAG